MNLKNVLYVPKLAMNILSHGKLDNEGYDIRLGSCQLQVYDEQGALLLHVKKNESGLYLHKLNVVSKCLMAVETCSETVKWHKRYGHLNLHSLKILSEKEMVRGLPKIERTFLVRRTCVASKQHRQPFSRNSNYRAKVSLELVHANLCGPFTPTTLGGSNYFMLLVDDCTQLMWVALLKSKAKAFEAFKKFNNLSEAEKKVKLKCLKTNRGGEFNSF